MKNQNDELVPMQIQNNWRVCIYYRKLNQVTHKDHIPLPFIDQILEKLAGKSHYCFLDEFSRYMQIHIAPKDQHKTTFTCPFDTFAYTRMPFGLCNAPSTFQCCMTSIFSDMLQNCMEVFMDDFTVYADSFDACLENLSKKDVDFKFDQPYVEAFQELKNSPTSVPILQAPNWDYPFKLMCDASNSALGVVLGQKAEVDKQAHVIAYASRTMDPAQLNYTTKKELLAIVFALDKFPSYLIGSKIIVFSNHVALRFLLKKSDAKPQLIRWMLLLQEFNIVIRDKKDICNFVAASQFPPKASRLYKERLKSDPKYYIWDDPYLWRLYNDQVIHKCVLDAKIESILQFCHVASEGGHYRSTQIA
ncbi:hypothetical protein CR513_20194, partial [Mucuna pruriens]